MSRVQIALSVLEEAVGEGDPSSGFRNSRILLQRYARPDGRFDTVVVDRIDTTRTLIRWVSERRLLRSIYVSADVVSVAVASPVPSLDRPSRGPTPIPASLFVLLRESLPTPSAHPPSTSTPAIATGRIAVGVYRHDAPDVKVVLPPTVLCGALHPLPSGRVVVDATIATLSHRDRPPRYHAALFLIDGPRYDVVSIPFPSPSPTPIHEASSTPPHLSTPPRLSRPLATASPLASPYAVGVGGLRQYHPPTPAEGSLRPPPFDARSLHHRSLDGDAFRLRLREEVGVVGCGSVAAVDAEAAVAFRPEEEVTRMYQDVGGGVAAMKSNRSASGEEAVDVILIAMRERADEGGEDQCTDAGDVVEVGRKGFMGRRDDESCDVIIVGLSLSTASPSWNERSASGVLFRRRVPWRALSRGSEVEGNAFSCMGNSSCGTSICCCDGWLRRVCSVVVKVPTLSTCTFVRAAEGGLGERGRAMGGTRERLLTRNDHSHRHQYVVVVGPSPSGSLLCFGYSVGRTHVSPRTSCVDTDAPIVASSADDGCVQWWSIPNSELVGIIPSLHGIGEGRVVAVSPICSLASSAVGVGVAVVAKRLQNVKYRHAKCVHVHAFVAGLLTSSVAEIEMQPCRATLHTSLDTAATHVRALMVAQCRAALPVVMQLRVPVQTATEGMRRLVGAILRGCSFAVHCARNNNFDDDSFENISALCASVLRAAAAAAVCGTDLNRLMSVAAEACGLLQLRSTPRSGGVADAEGRLSLVPDCVRVWVWCGVVVGVHWLSQEVTVRATHPKIRDEVASVVVDASLLVMRFLATRDGGVPLDSEASQQVFGNCDAVAGAVLSPLDVGVLAIHAAQYCTFHAPFLWAMPTSRRREICASAAVAAHLYNDVTIRSAARSSVACSIFPAPFDVLSFVTQYCDSTTRLSDEGVAHNYVRVSVESQMPAPLRNVMNQCGSRDLLTLVNAFGVVAGGVPLRPEDAATRLLRLLPHDSSQHSLCDVRTGLDDCSLHSASCRSGVGPSEPLSCGGELALFGTVALQLAITHARRAPLATVAEAVPLAALLRRLDLFHLAWPIPLLVACDAPSIALDTFIARCQDAVRVAVREALSAPTFPAAARCDADGCSSGDATCDHSSYSRDLDAPLAHSPRASTFATPSHMGGGFVAFLTKCTVQSDDELFSGTSGVVRSVTVGAAAQCAANLPAISDSGAVPTAAALSASALACVATAAAVGEGQTTIASRPTFQTKTASTAPDDCALVLQYARHALDHGPPPRSSVLQREVATAAASQRHAIAQRVARLASRWLGRAAEVASTAAPPPILPHASAATWWRSWVHVAVWSDVRASVAASDLDPTIAVPITDEESASSGSTAVSSRVALAAALRTAALPFGLAFASSLSVSPSSAACLVVPKAIFEARCTSADARSRRDGGLAVNVIALSPTDYPGGEAQSAIRTAQFALGVGAGLALRSSQTVTSERARTLLASVEASAMPPQGPRPSTTPPAVVGATLALCARGAFISGREGRIRTNLYRFLRGASDDTIAAVFVGNAAACAGTQQHVLEAAALHHHPATSAVAGAAPPSETIQTAAIVALGLLNRGHSPPLLSSLLMNELRAHNDTASPVSAFYRVAAGWALGTLFLPPDKVGPSPADDFSPSVAAAKVEIGLARCSSAAGGHPSRARGASDCALRSQTNVAPAQAPDVATKVLVRGLCELLKPQPASGYVSTVTDVAVDGVHLATSTHSHRGFAKPSAELLGGQFAPAFPPPAPRPRSLRDPRAARRVFESNCIHPPLCAEAAAVALSLMFLKTSDPEALAALAVPQEAAQLSHVPPDVAAARTVATMLVDWRGVAPSISYVESMIPSCARPSGWRSEVPSGKVDGRGFVTRSHSAPKAPRRKNLHCGLTAARSVDERFRGGRDARSGVRVGSQSPLSQRSSTGGVEGRLTGHVGVDEGLFAVPGDLGDDKGSYMVGIQSIVPDLENEFTTIGHGRGPPTLGDLLRKAKAARKVASTLQADGHPEPTTTQALAKMRRACREDSFERAAAPLPPSFAAVMRAFCVGGVAFGLGIRFAGTCDLTPAGALSLLLLRRFVSGAVLFDDPLWALPRPCTVPGALRTSLLAHFVWGTALLYAGSGEPRVHATLRAVWRAHSTTSTPYGVHIVMAVAIGLLFCGGGNAAVPRDNAAISHLLIGLYTRLPNAPQDDGTVQMSLRLLSPLILRRQVLQAVDVCAGVSVPVKLRVCVATSHVGVVSAAAQRGRGSRPRRRAGSVGCAPADLCAAHLERGRARMSGDETSSDEGDANPRWCEVFPAKIKMISFLTTSPDRLPPPGALVSVVSADPSYVAASLRPFGVADTTSPSAATGDPLGAAEETGESGVGIFRGAAHVKPRWALSSLLVAAGEEACLTGGVIPLQPIQDDVEQVSLRATDPKGGGAPLTTGSAVERAIRIATHTVVGVALSVTSTAAIHAALLEYASAAPPMSREGVDGSSLEAARGIVGILRAMLQMAIVHEAAEGSSSTGCPCAPTLAAVPVGAAVCAVMSLVTATGSSTSPAGSTRGRLDSIVDALESVAVATLEDDGERSLLLLLRRWVQVCVSDDAGASMGWSVHPTLAVLSALASLPPPIAMGAVVRGWLSDPCFRAAVGSRNQSPSKEILHAAQASLPHTQTWFIPWLLRATF